jgi:hypothetical protein
MFMEESAAKWREHLDAGNACLSALSAGVALDPCRDAPDEQN